MLASQMEMINTWVTNWDFLPPLCINNNSLPLLSIFSLLYSLKGYQQGLLTPQSLVIN